MHSQVGDGMNQRLRPDGLVSENFRLVTTVRVHAEQPHDVRDVAVVVLPACVKNGTVATQNRIKGMYLIVSDPTDIVPFAVHYKHVRSSLPSAINRAEATCGAEHDIPIGQIAWFKIRHSQTGRVVGELPYRTRVVNFHFKESVPCTPTVAGHGKSNILAIQRDTGVLHVRIVLRQDFFIL